MAANEIDGYKLGEIVMVIWSDDMAARFPKVSHGECRVMVNRNDFNDFRCLGWHCNRCGVAVGASGSHDCPDRV